MEKLKKGIKLRYLILIASLLGIVQASLWDPVGTYVNFDLKLGDLWAWVLLPAVIPAVGALISYLYNKTTSLSKKILYSLIFLLVAWMAHLLMEVSLFAYFIGQLHSSG